MLPSTALVCASSTTAAMPASASSAVRNDSRTGSLDVASTSHGLLSRSRLCLTLFRARRYGARVPPDMPSQETSLDEVASPSPASPAPPTAPGRARLGWRGRADRPGRLAAARSGGLQPHHRGAHGQPGGADPAARRAHRRRRRQAAAPAADARLARGCAATGRRRRAACQARRLRRVHPHRHAAARRRGGREPAAPRAGLGQRGVRQQGLGAGRRLPVRPRLPAHGGGRLAGGAGHPVARRRDHRRGRGAAACHPERPVHVRGALPRGDQGQDRGPVRRRLRGRRRGGRAARDARRRRWPNTA